MASISSRLLFVTTSPRTPDKMIPEIKLLVDNFTGQDWNKHTQTEFMGLLREELTFKGEGAKDPAFSARDRINRAPQSLGFVVLYPKIELTSAGKEYIEKSNTEEIFLRQLLKFQIPSPYHTLGNDAAPFCVKPYLELFRLIRHFGTLSFDELMIFGMQLIDYNEFEQIVLKINNFRDEKLTHKGDYKKFKKDVISRELSEIFSNRILDGNIKTRESREESKEKFLKTQESNLRDYADACIRYIRATGLINISHIGKSLSVIKDRVAEVDYFLKTIPREPCFIDDKGLYIKYLTDAQIPHLLTDEREFIEVKLKKLDISFTDKIDTESLKEKYREEQVNVKKENLDKKIKEIKDYRAYDDIKIMFKQIQGKELYDAPLMFEWNVWRAMTMLNGGIIQANLKFDDFGNPMSTAQGNKADIVCDYGDFGLSVEVTLQSGARQYEMEGEPVSRHLSKYKKEIGKDAYCLFLSPSINEACIAHFYMLHRTNIEYYGGVSNILPLPLDIFMKMVEESYKASSTPTPKDIKKLFVYSHEVAKTSLSESEWYNQVLMKARTWLA